MIKIVDVIIPVPLEGTFSYRLKDSDRSIPIGARVIVPFGKSDILLYAIVINIYEDPNEQRVLKSVEHIIHEPPLVTTDEIKSWQWASNYYMYPISSFMIAALPSSMLATTEADYILTNGFENKDFIHTNLSIDIINKFHEANKRPIRLSKLIKKDDPSRQKELLRLVDEGIITLYSKASSEGIKIGIPHIHLSSYYNSFEVLEQLIADLGRSKAQRKIIQDLIGTLDEENLTLNQSIPKYVLSQGDPNRLQAIKKLIDKEVLIQHNAVEKITIDTKQLTFDTDDTVAQIHPSIPLLKVLPNSIKQDLLVAQYCLNELRHSGRVLVLTPYASMCSSSTITTIMQSNQVGNLYTYNGKTSDKQKLELRSKLINSTESLVVIGIRSASLLPLERFSLIIITDQEDSNYKQSETSPRFNARDYTVAVAKANKIPLLLTSINETAESNYSAIHDERISFIQPNNDFIANSNQIEILDLKNERKIRRLKRDAIISNDLINRINASVQKGMNVLLLHNRMGYAPHIECNSCGNISSCPNCSVHLVYHKRTNTLQCHYCGYTIQYSSRCEVCHDPSTQTKIFGFGVERVCEEVRKHFPDNGIISVDSSTFASQKSQEEFYNLIYSHCPSIFIGTKILAYHLNLKNIGLIGILNFDLLTSGTNFRSSEQGYNLTMRFIKNYPMIPIFIQTYTPDNPLLMLLSNEGSKQFIKQELALRSVLNFPPFTRLIHIYVRSKDEISMNRVSMAIKRQLVTNGLFVQIEGPIKTTIERINLYYYAYNCIRINRSSHWELVRLSILQSIDIVKKECKFVKKCQIFFDVDPT